MNNKRDKTPVQSLHKLREINLIECAKDGIQLSGMNMGSLSCSTHPC